MREHIFRSPDVEINYAEGPPNGRPFVILHGGSTSWRAGRTFTQLLSGTWHVYAPDLRGHGKSGRQPGHYKLRDYARDIAIFLGEVVGEPSVIFGHSLGGEVAIMLAAEHPEFVRAVINGDAPLSRVNHPTEEESHRRMNALWYSLAGRPASEIALALKAMRVSVAGKSSAPANEAFGAQSPWFDFQAENLSRLDPGVLEAVLKGPDFMLEGYDPERILSAIACPVLLLQADPSHGGVLTDDQVQDGIRQIRNVHHVRLAGIGHELHQPPDQALRVYQAIAGFLSSL